MQTTVYVSNLPYTATDSDLQAHFGVYGSIKNIKLLTDKETGRPRGIAFVEYMDESTASDAIVGTDKKDFMGRALNVSLARPKGQRPERSFQPREARPQREYNEYAQPEMTWHDPSFNKRDRRDRRDNRRKYDR